MKILFDTSTPRPIRRFLRGHQVIRMAELGWAALANGKLLTAAEEAGYDVLLTCDQSLRYQQNFHGRRVAVVILSTNEWLVIRQKVARLESIVEFAQPGQVIFVDIKAL